MANKKNDTKETILKAAFHLFYENGYDKTTYQSIADAIGKKRTIVQHHFPEKSIFPYIFLDRLNVSIRSYLTENGLSKGHDFSSLYNLGQIYYTFLTMDDKMKRFTKELIGKREYTVKLATLNKNWTTDYFRNTPVLKDIPIAKIEENYMMAMGGTYEIMYDGLINNKGLYDTDMSKRTIVTFFVSIGYDADEINDLITNNELSNEELSAAHIYLKNEFFSDDFIKIAI